MTGSLSAVLVLLGLGISLAGAFGAKIPADSAIQLGTWLLATICGGQAAYSVWAREHTARTQAEGKLATKGLTLSSGNMSALAYDTGYDHLGKHRVIYLVSIKNETEAALQNCMLQVIVPSVEGYEHSYPLCEPFSLLVDERKEIPFIEHNSEDNQHLVLPVFWKQTKEGWTRELGGLIASNFPEIVLEALSSATRAVRLRLVPKFESGDWRFDVPP